MTPGPLSVALGLAGVAAATGVIVAAAHHHGTAGPRTIDNMPVIESIATPSPTPTPTPPPPSPPPATIDLIWRTVANNGRMLEALDWSGTVRGTFALPDRFASLDTVEPTADGQKLLIGTGDVTHVFTAQGVDLGTLTTPPLPWPADDDMHFCSMKGGGSEGQPQDLSLLTLGGPSRHVATFAIAGRGNGGADIAACNLENDIAVISAGFGDDAAGHVTDIRVLRLSTGATLRYVRPPAPDFRGGDPRPVPGALSFVVASADGRLLALNPFTGMMQDSPRTTAEIVDSVSGTVLGHVHGTVTGFTRDDRAVMTLRGAVNWRTGAVVLGPPWCCDGLVREEPGSPEAVVVTVPGGPLPTAGSAAEYPPDDYVLIRPDGTRLTLACCGAKVL